MVDSLTECSVTGGFIRDEEANVTVTVEPVDYVEKFTYF